MQYSCETNDVIYPIGRGYLSCNSLGYIKGRSFSFSPAMLVTGTTLEEVALNALLV